MGGHEILSETSTSTILLVEDHEDFAEILKFELESLGFNIIACDDIHSAINLLDRNSDLDLILSDYRLSKHTAKILLTHDWVVHNSIPVLIMTGLDSSNDKEILQHGVCGILRKPFELNELKSEIARCLGSQNLDTE